jgi:putative FmdB family regulatory protein
MPIYEYRCSACQHKLESLQRFADAPLKTCPVCHADALVKLVSAAGFQLKGSGWYATDFKNSGSKPAAKDKSDSAKGSTDKGGEASSGGGDATATATSDSAKSDSAPAKADGGGKKDTASTASAAAAPAPSAGSARSSE